MGQYENMKIQSTGILGIESELGPKKIEIKKDRGHNRYVYSAEDLDGPSVLALKVVKRLLEKHPIVHSKIGLVVNCSFAPSDYALWSLAGYIQHEANISSSQAFDLYQGCAGFIQGLQLASQAITLGQCEAVLLFSSEWYPDVIPDRLTKSRHWSDAATAALIVPYDNNCIARLKGGAFKTDYRVFGPYLRGEIGNRKGVDWRIDHHTTPSASAPTR